MVKREGKRKHSRGRGYHFQIPILPKDTQEDIHFQVVINVQRHMNICLWTNGTRELQVGHMPWPSLKGVSYYGTKVASPPASALSLQRRMNQDSQITELQPLLLVPPAQKWNQEIITSQHHNISALGDTASCDGCLQFMIEIQKEQRRHWCLYDESPLFHSWDLLVHVWEHSCFNILSFSFQWAIIWRVSYPTLLIFKKQLCTNLFSIFWC